MRHYYYPRHTQEQLWLCVCVCTFSKSVPDKLASEWSSDEGWERERVCLLRDSGPAALLLSSLTLLSSRLSVVLFSTPVYGPLRLLSLARGNEMSNLRIMGEIRYEDDCWCEWESPICGHGLSEDGEGQGRERHNRIALWLNDSGAGEAGKSVKHDSSRRCVSRCTLSVI